MIKFRESRGVGGFVKTSASPARTSLSIVSTVQVSCNVLPSTAYHPPSTIYHLDPIMSHLHDHLPSTIYHLHPIISHPHDH